VCIKRNSERGEYRKMVKLEKGRKNARLPFDLLKKNQANLSFLVFKFGSIFSGQFFAKSNGKYVRF
jgi:hypothetical protein